MAEEALRKAVHLPQGMQPTAFELAGSQHPRPWTDWAMRSWLSNAGSCLGPLLKKKGGGRGDADHCYHLLNAHHVLF